MSEKKKINSKVLIGCIAGVVITMSAIIAILIAVKNLKSATTMRLLRFDGDISLMSRDGKAPYPNFRSRRLRNFSR